MYMIRTRTRARALRTLRTWSLGHNSGGSGRGGYVVGRTSSSVDHFAADYARTRIASFRPGYNLDDRRDMTFTVLDGPIFNRSAP
jgi:hypothetical protein